jgi:hypothetical protein
MVRVCLSCSVKLVKNVAILNGYTLIYTVVHVLCVIRLFNFHTLSTFNIIFSKTCIVRLNGQPTSNSIFHTTYLMAALRLFLFVFITL